MITDDVFEVAYVGRRRFVIDFLRDVHIVRQDPESDPTVSILGVSSLGISVMVIPVVGRVSTVLAGVLVAILAISVVMNFRRENPVRWNLVGLYAGRVTTLFSSTDQSEFEQVCRGLQRSLEHHSDVR